MIKWLKENKILATIIFICATLSSVYGGIKAYKGIKQELRSSLHDMLTPIVKNYLDSKEGNQKVINNLIKSDEVKRFIVDQVAVVIMNRKSGFRSDIADGLDVPVDEITPYLIEIIKIYQNTNRIGPITLEDDPDNIYYIDINKKKYAATRENGEWFVWDPTIEGSNKWRKVD